MKVEKPSNFCRLIGSNVKMQLSEKRNTQIEFGTMMLHFFLVQTDQHSCVSTQTVQNCRCRQM